MNIICHQEILKRYTGTTQATLDTTKLYLQNINCGFQTQISLQSTMHSFFHYSLCIVNYF